MNKKSEYWTKHVEMVAKNGKVVIIKCDGWTFVDDEKQKTTGSINKF